MNFVLSLFLLLNLNVQANDPTSFVEIPAATNLDGLKEAQDFSKYLLAEKAGEDSTKKRSFIVMHVGETLPEELQWVVLELEKAGHHIVVKQIKERDTWEDIESDFKSGDKIISRLTYDKDVSEAAVRVQKERVEMRERAKLYLKKLFGIPRGFTYWFKIKRDAKQVSADAGFAALQMALAGTSVAMSFYAKSLTPGAAEVNYIAPAVSLAVWHGLNMFYLNNVLALFGQGRSLKKVNDDTWMVTKNVTLIRTLSFVRAMITNYIIMIAAFGPETAFSPASLKVSLFNSFLTLFSRFWFDELSAKKQITIAKDGSFEIRKGQWSPMKMTVIRNVFEFVNGALKNLHLIGARGMNWIFPASGVYGLIRTAYLDRRDYWPKIQQLFKRGEATACSSLLIEEAPNSSSL